MTYNTSHLVSKNCCCPLLIIFCDRYYASILTILSLRTLYILFFPHFIDKETRSQVNLYQQSIQTLVEVTLFPLTLSLHCLSNAHPIGPLGREGEGIRQTRNLYHRLWGTGKGTGEVAISP